MNTSGLHRRHAVQHRGEFPPFRIALIAISSAITSPGMTAPKYVARQREPCYGSAQWPRRAIEPSERRPLEGRKVRSCCRKKLGPPMREDRRNHQGPHRHDRPGPFLVSRFGLNLAMAPGAAQRTNRGTESGVTFPRPKGRSCQCDGVSGFAKSNTIIKMSATRKSPARAVSGVSRAHDARRRERMGGLILCYFDLPGL